MKKLIVLIICSSIFNIVTAQKKETKIILNTFTKNTLIRNGFKRNKFDGYEPFYTKNNFKEGNGSNISAVFFGKNIFESESDVDFHFQYISYHKYVLFCIINGQNIKLESHWYDQDPHNNIEFENQNYTIKLKYDEEPYMFEKWQMLVINKADFKSTIFNLYHYNAHWGE